MVEDTMLARANRFGRRVSAASPLDFTKQSLDVLSRAIEVDASDEALSEAAAYYGEVLRRELGGAWTVPSEPFVSIREEGTIQTGAPGAGRPCVALEGGIVVDVMETSARYLAGETNVFAEECQELAFELERGPVEVFDDGNDHEALVVESKDERAAWVFGGLLLHWLATRNLLVPRWARDFAAIDDRPAEAYWQLGGRLSSAAVVPEADRFLREYVIGGGATSVFSDFEAIAPRAALSDDVGTRERVAKILDDRFAAFCEASQK